MSQPSPFPREKIRALLSFAYHNPHCDFYRAFWKEYGITSVDVDDVESLFASIPPVTRELLAERIDPSERLFINTKDICLLRSTSGTSGRPPFLFWTENFSCDYLYRELFRRGVRRGIFFCSAENFTRVALEANNAQIGLVYGDPHDLKRAAARAHAAQVDTLMLSPTLAAVVAPYLSTAGCIDAITHLFLYGEQCSAALHEQLRALYPHAQFVFQYAQSEVNGTIGLSTDRCTSPHNTFHLRTDALHLELEEGEIILTTLTTPRAQPLIRYRTGDVGEYVPGVCACGNSAPRIRLGGRKQGDFVRAGGGEFKAEELERVLAPFADMIEPVFQLALTESMVGEQRIVQPVLTITPKSSATLAGDLLAAEIYTALMAHFRLSASYMLKDAVDAHLIEPPLVRVDTNPTINHKNPRIIFRHHA